MRGPSGGSVLPTPPRRSSRPTTPTTPTPPRPRTATTMRHAPPPPTGAEEP
uniref:Uncharacterized protein n=1 Tax=Arundo donax TaxID=35708 RepID=A0A0A9HMH7_ARUDO